MKRLWLCPRYSTTGLGLGFLELHDLNGPMSSQWTVYTATGLTNIAANRYKLMELVIEAKIRVGLSTSKLVGAVNCALADLCNLKRLTVLTSSEADDGVTIDLDVRYWLRCLVEAKRERSLRR